MKISLTYASNPSRAQKEAVFTLTDPGRFSGERYPNRTPALVCTSMSRTHFRQCASQEATQRETAQKMGVSDRWVRVPLKRMSKQDDAGVGAWIERVPVERNLAAEPQQRQALAILKQRE